MRGGEPIEHGIGRRHRGKRDVKTLSATRSHQSMGNHQRRFGLAAAGLVFDHEECRPGRQLHGPRPFLHRARCRSGAEQTVIFEIAADTCWQYPGVLDRLGSPLAGVAPIGVELLLWFPVGEPVLVGPDPVRQYSEAGESVGRPPDPCPVDSR